MNVKITQKLHKKLLTRKSAITRRLIDIFNSNWSISWDIHLYSLTFVDFIFNMHSNIYSILFHDANIKEENIIDSKFSLNWCEHSYLTTNKKNAKHIYCLYSISKCTERWDLVIIKKNTQSFLRLLGGLRGMNGLENVKYKFQACTR